MHLNGHVFVIADLSFPDLTDDARYDPLIHDELPSIAAWRV